ncbi:mechanosensitive ion channel family protein [Thermodesulfobacteriota bacterium]
MRFWETIQQYIDKLTGDPSSYSAVFTKALMAIVLAVILWFVLKLLLAFLQRKGRQFEIIRDNAIIFQSVSRAVTIILVFATGIYIFRMMNIPVLETAFQALMMLFLAAPAVKVTIVILQTIEKRIVHKTETKVDNVIFDLLTRFVGVIIYIVAIILALDLLGVNVMPFIAGAGVLGIAIGFAAKDTLSNLIAGVLLIIDRPFEIGDRIEVWTAPSGSSTWGDVIDIGIRATKIKTTDNIVIIIPNNEIMKRDIINYTIISSKIRVRINIGVAYNADLPRAKQIILDIADTIEWIAKEPKPKVVVRLFGESSVDLQVRAWIKDARKRMDTISEITDKVKEAFDQHGIEIPYPRRDIVITHRPSEPVQKNE